MWNETDEEEGEETGDPTQKVAVCESISLALSFHTSFRVVSLELAETKGGVGRFSLQRICIEKCNNEQRAPSLREDDDKVYRNYSLHCLFYAFIYESTHT